jgi:hypothetical protein
LAVSSRLAREKAQAAVQNKAVNEYYKAKMAKVATRRK